MRILFFILVFCFKIVSSLTYAHDETTCENYSHSFFRARPLSQDMSFFMDQLHFYQAHIKNRNKKNKEHTILSLEGIAVYQQSINQSNIASYFSKNNNACPIIIAQSPLDGPDPIADINSTWIQLQANLNTNNSPFSSSISFHPERRLAGAIIKGVIDTDHWLKGTFLTLIVPIVTVHHKLGFKECDQKGTGSLNGIITASDAFNNPAWSFGKMPLHTVSKAGFDDIQLQAYWRFFQHPRCALAIYGNIFIPASHGSHANVLFEPTIGNGGHVGAGAGFHAGFVLYDNKQTKKIATLVLNSRYTYFFEHNEHRSFDLCTNGNWSRYLLVAQDNNLSISLPGINYLSRKVAITPRSNIELLTMFHYTHGHLNFEIGHDYWFQQKESVDIHCSQQPDIGIYDLPRSLNVHSGPFSTASTAHINQAYGTISDPSPTMITNNALNIQSGTNPKASSCKLFGSIGYDTDYGNYPAIWAVGGSYEWGHKKSALSQWGIMFKTGVSF